MEKMFTRDGNEFTGKIETNEKGQPVYTFVDKCHRCGGTGGWSGWPGFTCYRCAGQCYELAKLVRLYTAEQLAKLNASELKRTAKKEAKRATEQAEAAAKLVVTTAEFDAKYADLLKRLASVTLNERTQSIVDDILRKGREYAILSENQEKFLSSIVDKAEAHVRTQAQSAHVGTIGERFDATVTVTQNAKYERAAFNSGRMETVYITTMEDANGNQIVVKSPNFQEDKGQSFVLRGTIKEHSEYRGVKQTVLQRAKRVESK